MVPIFSDENYKSSYGIDSNVKKIIREDENDSHEGKVIDGFLFD